MSADPRIGSELAGYRIERLLGRGGMSVVYLAEDLRLGRKVALKLLAPELAEDERFRERFLRESRLAASLDHANVIPIYEAGETEGVLYIAMRYVEGTDLKRLLAHEGTLKPRRALDLLGQAGEALDAAHAHGLVHRDVKPGNMLIAEQGGREHVYLSDFGLTKQTSSESGLTETGQFVGTADYVSPEQIERKPADARSDLYSLGCVLYECLVGEAPYRGESLMGVLWAHLNAAPPSVNERRPELASGIDAVVAKAMAKDPAARYASCRELVESARAELPASGEPVASARRRPRWTLIGAGAAVVIAAAAAVPAILLARGDERPAQPNPALAVTTDSLVRIDPKTNEVVAVTKVGSNPTAVAFGEGAVWVADRDDGTVSRIDPGTGEVTRTVSVGGSPQGIAAGDGSVWVVGFARGEGTLTELNPRTGQIQRSVSLGFGNSRAVAVGDEAVWVTADDLVKGNAVLRVSPVSAEVIATITLPFQPGDVTVSTEGVWVGTGYLGEPTVERIDPATNREAGTVELSSYTGSVVGAEGAVWATLIGGNSVVKIDSQANLVTETISVGGNPSGIAVGEGSIWVANHNDYTVSRIDPRTSEVVTTIEIGGPRLALGYGPVMDVAAGAGAVWVTVPTP